MRFIIVESFGMLQLLLSRECIRPALRRLRRSSCDEMDCFDPNSVLTTFGHLACRSMFDHVHHSRCTCHRCEETGGQSYRVCMVWVVKLTLLVQTKQSKYTFDVWRVDELSVLVYVLLKFYECVFFCDLPCLAVKEYVFGVICIISKRSKSCSVNIYFS